MKRSSLLLGAAVFSLALGACSSSGTPTATDGTTNVSSDEATSAMMQDTSSVPDAMTGDTISADGTVMSASSAY